MNDDDRTNLIMTAIGHVIERNPDGAATALTTIGENSNGSQMYAVCCALAEAAKHFLPKIFGEQPPDVFYVLEELHPGALTEKPANGFSARFMTAYANGDTDTCLALFDAAFKASGEEYVESVTALLGDVGGLARLALDLKRSDPTTADGSTS